MSTWLSIASFPVCLAVTVAGLALSALAWRKRGVRSGVRGIAWSVLPIALWLTHSIGLVGHIGSAVVQFAQGFAFSPRTWFGVALLAAAALLFLGSGGIPLLRWRRRKRRATQGSETREVDRQAAPSVPAKRHAPQVTAGDDDLKDVDEILRRHGIG